MKKIILPLLFSFLFVSCNEINKNSNTQIKESGVVSKKVVKTITKDINSIEFKQKIDNQKGILLDVRTKDEFKGGFIDGAINIDFYASNFIEEVDQLDKTKPLYIYCASGGRSGQAMKKIESLGFSEIYNLIGGYSAWEYK